MEQQLAQVVRDLQNGEAVEENFRRLFDHLYRPLSRVFARQGVEAGMGEDFIQEVLTRVYQEIREYRWEAPFEAWVLQIARNHLRKHFRSQQALKRQHEDVQLFDDEPGSWQQASLPREAVSTGQEQPLLDLLAGERRHLLRRAVAGLPAQMRRCMTLRLERDLDYRDIGQILRISEQTVKVHMFQARKRLEEGLKTYFESAETVETESATGGNTTAKNTTADKTAADSTAADSTAADSTAADSTGASDTKPGRERPQLSTRHSS
ncbi:MAG: sigma-70 family RNA polymerase sigma factor [Deltaproteobacteria bacterium]|nr:sigma-70 family RNA polymerase sigma factor [Deltaproteobacteria bacterium]